MSKIKCCVPGCMDSESSHKTKHSFPNPEKDRKRFNQWVFSIGGNIIRLDNEDIYKRRSVCHAHFEEKYCCRLNRLSSVAVPTLNLPGPLSLPKFTFEERRPSRQIQNSTPTTSKDIYGDHNYDRADMVYHDHNYPRTDTTYDPAAPGTHEEFNFGKPPKVSFKADALLPRFLNDDKAQPVELTENEEPGPKEIGDTVEESFVDDDEMQCEDVADESVQMERPFSWQQPSAVVPCDADTLEDDHPERDLIRGDEPGHSGTTWIAGTLEVAGTPRDLGAPGQETTWDIETLEQETHALYQCNVCEHHIHGFRYLCVQCADFDLCGACEAAGRHRQHYVLRVPPDNTKEEVEAVLQTIRRAVTNCFVHLNEGDIEVKEETDQEDPIAVGLGVPYIQEYTEDPTEPTVPHSEYLMVSDLVPDVCNALDILYAEKSISKNQATVSPKQTQIKPSNVALQLDGDDSGSFIVTTQTTKAINTLQLKQKHRNTSDTQVVTIPTSDTNTVPVPEQIVKVYMNTSSVSAVTVQAQCLNHSTGATKRCMPEIVTEMMSPERKKVATVPIQRLTKEEIKAVLHKS